jgi:hypothetical protein
MATRAILTVDHRDTIAAGCVSVLLVALSWSLFGDINLNFADEGFLWYGAERTAAGDVPLRDFQSYEPGRYYWIAIWSTVLGDGILSTRLSLSIFQALGLTCGLLVACRVVGHRAWLLPVGMLLLSWMYPHYKAFEPSLAMIAVYVGLRLVESGSLASFFMAGGFVGLVSFFGRNHALYAGLGILALTLWIQRRRGETPLSRRLACLTAGSFLGSLPLVGMMIFVPDFAASLWASVVFFVEHGANLPAPIPWPWQVDYAGMVWRLRATHFFMGSLFILVPLVYVVGLTRAFRISVEPTRDHLVLLAASTIGVFYLHHAAIRSDATHLVQAIHPAVLAALAIPGALGWSRRGARALAIWGAVVLITISITPTANPAFALPWQEKARRLVPVVVGGDALRLSPASARWVGKVEDGVGRHVPEKAALFIAPYTPGLYPLLRKESPVWGLYLLWEVGEERQDEMILRLEREDVDWALISSGAMDGRDELRFWNTHARVWAYFERDFEIVREPTLPDGLLLLRRKPGRS